MKRKLSDYKHGGATKKGALFTRRMLTKEHSNYSLYFREDGSKRTEQEIKNIQKIMKGGVVAKCKKCDAEILFLRTSKGNLIPVDVESVSRDEQHDLKQGKDVLFVRGQHITHFSSCKFADDFRKKKKSEATA